MQMVYNGQNSFTDYQYSDFHTKVADSMCAISHLTETCLQNLDTQTWTSRTQSGISMNTVNEAQPTSFYSMQQMQQIPTVSTAQSSCSTQNHNSVPMVSQEGQFLPLTQFTAFDSLNNGNAYTEPATPASFNVPFRELAQTIAPKTLYSTQHDFEMEDTGSEDQHYFTEPSEYGGSIASPMWHNIEQLQGDTHMFIPPAYGYSSDVSPSPTMKAKSSTRCSKDNFNDDEPPLDESTSQTVRRQWENQKLKEWRDSGVSYKQICARFKNKYSESTLRGRYRTLSKPRKDRVRKPRWYAEDVRYLTEAVRATPHPSDLSTIKWKDIAQNIVDRGGSYKFGVTTCKKKYVEVMEKGLEAVMAACNNDVVSKPTRK